MTGLVGAATVVVVLLVVPGLFRNLPTATLAAIVIAAAFALVEFDGVRLLAMRRRSEFVLSLVAFFGVALLGVLPGIALAVALSVLNFVRKSWRPTHRRARTSRRPQGLPRRRAPPGGTSRAWPAAVPVRCPALLRQRRVLPHRPGRTGRSGHPPVRRVVVAAEAVTDIDATGAEVLEELLDDLDERHVELAFAELKGTVRDRLVPYGLVERIGRHRFYPTIGLAVKDYVAEFGVPWIDWEDEAGPTP